MNKKGLFAAVAAFAASPPGRRAMNRAKDYATSPERNRKFQELRTRATDAVRKRRGHRQSPS
jgi:hypothetical protein